MISVDDGREEIGEEVIKKLLSILSRRCFGRSCCIGAREGIEEAVSVDLISFANIYRF